MTLPPIGFVVLLAIDRQIEFRMRSWLHSSGRWAVRPTPTPPWMHHSETQRWWHRLHPLLDPAAEPRLDPGRLGARLRISLVAALGLSVWIPDWGRLGTFIVVATVAASLAAFLYVFGRTSRPLRLSRYKIQRGAFAADVPIGEIGSFLVHPVGTGPRRGMLVTVPHDDAVVRRAEALDAALAQPPAARGTHHCDDDGEPVSVPPAREHSHLVSHALHDPVGFEVALRLARRLRRPVVFDRLGPAVSARGGRAESPSQRIVTPLMAATPLVTRLDRTDRTDRSPDGHASLDAIRHGRGVGVLDVSLGIAQRSWSRSSCFSRAAPDGRRTTLRSPLVSRFSPSCRSFGRAFGSAGTRSMFGASRGSGEHDDTSTRSSS